MNQNYHVASLHIIKNIDLYTFYINPIETLNRSSQTDEFKIKNLSFINMLHNQPLDKSATVCLRCDLFNIIIAVTIIQ